MARSFGLVDYKTQEAEFFLLQLAEAGKGFNFQEVQFCSSAFASAARSITFAMQSCLKGNLEFDNWYSTRQESLRSNSLAKFFHEFRRVTQHIGESAVGGGSFIGGDPLYYFKSSKDLPTVPDEDVLTACKQYFVLIIDLVFD